MNRKHKYYVGLESDGIWRVWMAKDGEEMKKVCVSAIGPFQTKKGANRQALVSNQHNATQVLIAVEKRSVRIGLIYNRTEVA